MQSTIRPGSHHMNKLVHAENSVHMRPCSHARGCRGGRLLLVRGGRSGRRGCPLAAACKHASVLRGLCQHSARLCQRADARQDSLTHTCTQMHTFHATSRAYAGASCYRKAGLAEGPAVGGSVDGRFCISAQAAVLHLAAPFCPTSIQL